jgi:crossover junction endodeoxyribonuclease RuvC
VNGRASVDRLLHLDSRASKSSHGELLADIFDLLTELAADATVFVRERGFSRFPHETQALYKVFGVADLAVWRCGKAAFHELAPTAIKKLLTGSGKATKEEVAAALERYVGRQCYATDDESDAVAAGLAWLIQTNRIEARS